MRTSTFIIMCLILAAPCQARIIYVDVNAPSNNDGSSWENAYNFLQDALADANSSGDVNEIWVAEGIYKPDENTVYPNGTGDQNNTFQLINGVAIYGGFPSGGGQWEVRDYNKYETILSGDLNGDDMQVNDPCDLQNEPTRADNSYHVVNGSGTDANTVLDGFTITAGKANGGGIEGFSGGGMYNDRAKLTVKNCVFTGNSARYSGGGMYNGGQDLDGPVITNCTFISNWARNWGGGMENETRATVTNCIFIVNDPSGMENDYVGSNVAGCTFTENIGLGMHNWQSYTVVVDCLFISNSDESNGGGMLTDEANAQVTNCKFINNSGYYGGMCNISNGAIVTNCMFSGNSTGSNGGGISVTGTGNPYIIASNCIFNGNSARRGGGIYNGGSESTLTNCTFSKNSAEYVGGGVYNDYSLTVKNCIMWGNIAVSTGDEIYNDNSTPTITYSDIRGGWSGTGNIDVDPCFMDENNPDPNLMSFRLKLDSPCIDAGDTTAVPIGLFTDADGNLRGVDDPAKPDKGISVFGVTVDMGAYEFQRCRIPGDINCECAKLSCCESTGQSSLVKG